MDKKCKSSCCEKDPTKESHTEEIIEISAPIKEEKPKSCEKSCCDSKKNAPPKEVEKSPCNDSECSKKCSKKESSKKSCTSNKGSCSDKSCKDKCSSKPILKSKPCKDSCCPQEGSKNSTCCSSEKKTCTSSQKVSSSCCEKKSCSKNVQPKALSCCDKPSCSKPVPKKSCSDSSCKDTSCSPSISKGTSCSDSKCIDSSCSDSKCKEKSCSDSKCKDASCSDIKCKDTSCSDSTCKDSCSIPLINEELPDIIIDKGDTINKIVTLSVGGMTCAGCGTKVVSYVTKMNGIESINVNVISAKAIVKYNSKVLSVEEIIKRVNNIGFEATEIEGKLKQGEVLFLFQNDSKKHEIIKVAEYFKTHKSYKYISHDEKGKNVKISYDENVTNPRKIMNEILEKTSIELSKTSKTFSYLEDSLLKKKEIKKYLILFLTSLIFTLPAMLIALVFGQIPFFNYDSNGNPSYLIYPIFESITPKVIALFILCTPVHLFFGWPFYSSGIKALFLNKSPDKNTLITLSCWVAFIVSLISIIYGMIDWSYEGENYLESSAVLISFLLFGQLLENYANSRTSKSLVKLLRLQPQFARLIVNVQDENELQIALKEKKKMEEKMIQISLVFKNDIIAVSPGEKIPTDGIIIHGQSSVDNAMITGESIPIYKTKGDEVIGGTYNLDGNLYLKVLKSSEDNVLSKIITMIEDAQMEKPKIQDAIDEVAKWFVPGIICVSIFVFFLWMFLSYLVIPIEWTNGMDRILFSLLHATSSLVMACPCTLGLAVPLVLMVANGIGAEHGILIKGGGTCFEMLKSVKEICFDKTGTLTEGKLSINDVIILQQEWKQSKKKEQLLKIIASCENCLKNHPIAHTIIEYVKGKLNVKNFVAPKKFESINGRGLKCILNDGRNVIIGNKSLMEEEKIFNSSTKKKHKLLQDDIKGKSLVYCAIDGTLITIITLMDQVKPEVKSVIAKLKEWDYNISMLTGDNTSVAKKIAQEVGIDQKNVHAELTPFGKTEYIKVIQKRKGVNNRVLFVGDGLNDSIALTQADVGVSMSTGTEIAMECSDIVLMKRSLNGLLITIDLVKKSWIMISLNVFWAFCYNILSVPIAGGLIFPLIRIIIPPWICSIMMTFSCVSLTINTIAFRLFYKQNVVKNMKK